MDSWNSLGFTVHKNNHNFSFLFLVHYFTLTWEYAHRSRKQTMESFPLPPRTVGMVSGWSELSFGIHAREDCQEPRMLCPLRGAASSALQSRVSRAASGESPCHCGRQRAMWAGRCCQRWHTHTRSSRREITTHSSHVDLPHSLVVTVVQRCKVQQGRYLSVKH